MPTLGYRMRQRRVAWVGTLVSFVLFIAANAKRGADFFAVLHLPKDVEEAMIAMAHVPVLISWTALAVGVLCLAYLLFSVFNHRPTDIQSSPVPISKDTFIVDPILTIMDCEVAGSNVHTDFIVTVEVRTERDRTVLTDWQLLVEADNGAHDEIRAMPIATDMTWGLSRGRNLRIAAQQFLLHGAHKSYDKGVVSGCVVFRTTKISYLNVKNFNTKLCLTASSDQKKIRSTSVSLREIKPKWAPPTLHDIFKADMKTGGLTGEIPFNYADGRELIKIESRIHWDFEARCYFLSFYIPKMVHAYDICVSISQNHKNLLSTLSAVEMTSGTGVQETSSVELMFSGRIYLYTEDNMSYKQLHEIKCAFRDKQLSVIFRQHEYLVARWNEPEFENH